MIGYSTIRNLCLAQLLAGAGALSIGGAGKAAATQDGAGAALVQMEGHTQTSHDDNYTGTEEVAVTNPACSCDKFNNIAQPVLALVFVVSSLMGIAVAALMLHNPTDQVKTMGVASFGGVFGSGGLLSVLVEQHGSSPLSKVFDSLKKFCACKNRSQNVPLETPLMEGGAAINQVVTPALVKYGVPSLLAFMVISFVGVIVGIVQMRANIQDGEEPFPPWAQASAIGTMASGALLGLLGNEFGLKTMLDSVLCARKKGQGEVVPVDEESMLKEGGEREDEVILINYSFIVKVTFSNVSISTNS